MERKKLLIIVGIAAAAVILLIIIGLILYFVVFDVKSYQKKGLKVHNEHREKHKARSLKLSRELNKIAIKCAKYYAEKNMIDHSCPYKKGSDGSSVGENLYMSWNAKQNEEEAVKEADKGWYNEEANYNYNTGASKNQNVTGHFTQLVWKGSQEVGFGFYHREDKKSNVVVAIYRPPGNYAGEYKENVEKPKGWFF